MKAAKLIAWVGFFAMAAVLINGFVNGSFSRDGAELLTNPWGIVSLVDLYVGFALFSIWVAYREEKIIAAVIWVVTIMVFGFFASSIYVLVALYRSNGSWPIFLLGNRNEQLHSRENN